MLLLTLSQLTVSGSQQCSSPISARTWTLETINPRPFEGIKGTLSCIQHVDELFYRPADGWSVGSRPEAAAVTYGRRFGQVTPRQAAGGVQVITRSDRSGLTLRVLGVSGECARHGVHFQPKPLVSCRRPSAVGRRVTAGVLSVPASRSRAGCAPHLADSADSHESYATPPQAGTQ